MEALGGFEWDESKAAQNLAKHGISFEFATRISRDRRRLDFDVSRADQREARRKTIGLIGNRLYAVIYTMRGSACRIISARRANASEERRYDYGPL
jgi:uncharacterized DUF497 family protein